MMGFIQQLKTIFSAVGFVLLTGLVGISSSVMASTPDGETPANEGVCDVLIGATPGLYGLCNAYCEAQDLDDFDKKPPSVKILANYNKKKKAGDPDMPCLQTPVADCPCWTETELASVNDGDGVGCSRLGAAIQVRDASPLHLADANTAAGSERCRYVDTGTSPITTRFFNISLDEAAACFSQVDALCTSIGQ
jgi:hypothetical protein